MFLIDSLLSAPIKGVVWLATKFNDIVEKEQYGEENIMARLMELQLRLELEEISEVEFEKAEKELLIRLNQGRE